MTIAYFRDMVTIHTCKMLKCIAWTHSGLIKWSYMYQYITQTNMLKINMVICDNNAITKANANLNLWLDIWSRDV